MFSVYIVAYILKTSVIFCFQPILPVTSPILPVVTMMMSDVSALVRCVMTTRTALIAATKVGVNQVMLLVYPKTNQRSVVDRILCFESKCFYCNIYDIEVFHLNLPHFSKKYHLKIYEWKYPNTISCISFYFLNVR